MNKNEYETWVNTYSIPSKILIIKLAVSFVIAYVVMLPFAATQNPVLTIIGVILFIAIPAPTLIKFVKLFILELKSFKAW